MADENGSPPTVEDAQFASAANDDRGTIDGNLVPLISLSPDAATQRSDQPQPKAMKTPRLKGAATTVTIDITHYTKLKATSLNTPVVLLRRQELKARTSIRSDIREFWDLTKVSEQRLQPTVPWETCDTLIRGMLHAMLPMLPDDAVEKLRDRFWYAALSMTPDSSVRQIVEQAVTQYRAVVVARRASQEQQDAGQPAAVPVTAAIHRLAYTVIINDGLPEPVPHLDAASVTALVRSWRGSDSGAKTDGIAPPVNTDNVIKSRHSLSNREFTNLLFVMADLFTNAVDELEYHQFLTFWMTLLQANVLHSRSKARKVVVKYAREMGGKIVDVVPVPRLNTPAYAQVLAAGGMWVASSLTPAATAHWAAVKNDRTARKQAVAPPPWTGVPVAETPWLYFDRDDPVCLHTLQQCIRYDSLEVVAAVRRSSIVAQQAIGAVPDAATGEAAAPSGSDETRQSLEAALAGMDALSQQYSPRADAPAAVEAVTTPPKPPPTRRKRAFMLATTATDQVFIVGKGQRVTAGNHSPPRARQAALRSPGRTGGADAITSQSGMLRDAARAVPGPNADMEPGRWEEATYGVFINVDWREIRDRVKSAWKERVLREGALVPVVLQVVAAREGRVPLARQASEGASRRSAQALSTDSINALGDSLDIRAPPHPRSIGVGGDKQLRDWELIGVRAVYVGEESGAGDIPGIGDSATAGAGLVASAATSGFMTAIPPDSGSQLPSYGRAGVYEPVICAPPVGRPGSESPRLAPAIGRRPSKIGGAEPPLRAGCAPVFVGTAAQGWKWEAYALALASGVLVNVVPPPPDDFYSACDTRTSSGESADVSIPPRRRRKSTEEFGAWGFAIGSDAAEGEGVPDIFKTSNKGSTALARDMEMGARLQRYLQYQERVPHILTANLPATTPYSIASLGTFSDQVSAAHAFDAAMWTAFGTSAITNYDLSGSLIRRDVVGSRIKRLVDGLLSDPSAASQQVADVEVHPRIFWPATAEASYTEALRRHGFSYADGGWLVLDRLTDDMEQEERSRAEESRRALVQHRAKLARLVGSSLLHDIKPAEVLALLSGPPCSDGANEDAPHLLTSSHTLHMMVPLPFVPPVSPHLTASPLGWVECDIPMVQLAELVAPSVLDAQMRRGSVPGDILGLTTPPAIPSGGNASDGGTTGTRARRMSIKMDRMRRLSQANILAGIGDDAIKAWRPEAMEIATSIHPDEAILDLTDDAVSLILERLGVMAKGKPRAAARVAVAGACIGPRRDLLGRLRKIKPDPRRRATYGPDKQAIREMKQLRMAAEAIALAEDMAWYDVTNPPPEEHHQRSTEDGAEEGWRPSRQGGTAVGDQEEELSEPETEERALRLAEEKALRDAEISAARQLREEIAKALAEENDDESRRKALAKWIAELAAAAARKKRARKRRQREYKVNARLAILARPKIFDPMRRSSVMEQVTEERHMLAERQAAHRRFYRRNSIADSMELISLKEALQQMMDADLVSKDRKPRSFRAPQPRVGASPPAVVPEREATPLAADATDAYVGRSDGIDLDRLKSLASAFGSSKFTSVTALIAQQPAPPAGAAGADSALASTDQEANLSPFEQRMSATYRLRLHAGSRTISQLHGSHMQLGTYDSNKVLQSPSAFAARSTSTVNRAKDILLNRRFSMSDLEVAKDINVLLKEWHGRRGEKYDGQEIDGMQRERHRRRKRKTKRRKAAGGDDVSQQSADQRDGTDSLPAIDDDDDGSISSSSFSEPSPDDSSDVDSCESEAGSEPYGYGGRFARLRRASDYELDGSLGHSFLLKHEGRRRRDEMSAMMQVYKDPMAKEFFAALKRAGEESRRKLDMELAERAQMVKARREARQQALTSGAVSGSDTDEVHLSDVRVKRSTIEHMTRRQAEYYLKAAVTGARRRQAAEKLRRQSIVGIDTGLAAAAGLTSKSELERSIGAHVQADLPLPDSTLPKVRAPSPSRPSSRPPTVPSDAWTPELLTNALSTALDHALPAPEQGAHVSAGATGVDVAKVAKVSSSRRSSIIQAVSETLTSLPDGMATITLASELLSRVATQHGLQVKHHDLSSRFNDLLAERQQTGSPLDRTSSSTRDRSKSPPHVVGSPPINAELSMPKERDGSPGDNEEWCELIFAHRESPPVPDEIAPPHRGGSSNQPDTQRLHSAGTTTSRLSALDAWHDSAPREVPPPAKAPKEAKVRTASGTSASTMSGLQATRATPRGSPVRPRIVRVRPSRPKGKSRRAAFPVRMVAVNPFRQPTVDTVADTRRFDRQEILPDDRAQLPLPALPASPRQLSKTEMSTYDLTGALGQLAKQRIAHGEPFARKHLQQKERVEPNHLLTVLSPYQRHQLTEDRLLDQLTRVVNAHLAEIEEAEQEKERQQVKMGRQIAQATPLSPYQRQVSLKESQLAPQLLSYVAKLAGIRHSRMLRTGRKQREVAFNRLGALIKRAQAEDQAATWPQSDGDAPQPQPALERRQLGGITMEAEALPHIAAIHERLQQLPQFDVAVLVGSIQRILQSARGEVSRTAHTAAPDIVMNMKGNPLKILRRICKRLNRVSKKLNRRNRRNYPSLPASEMRAQSLLDQTQWTIPSVDSQPGSPDGASVYEERLLAPRNPDERPAKPWTAGTSENAYDSSHERLTEARRRMIKDVISVASEVAQLSASDGKDDAAYRLSVDKQQRLQSMLLSKLNVADMAALEAEMTPESEHAIESKLVGISMEYAASVIHRLVEEKKAQGDYEARMLEHTGNRVMSVILEDLSRRRRSSLGHDEPLRRGRAMISSTVVTSSFDHPRRRSVSSIVSSATPNDAPEAPVTPDHLPPNPTPASTTQQTTDSRAVLPEADRKQPLQPSLPLLQPVAPSLPRQLIKSSGSRHARFQALHSKTDALADRQTRQKLSSPTSDDLKKVSIPKPLLDMFAGNAGLKEDPPAKKRMPPPTSHAALKTSADGIVYQALAGVIPRRRQARRQKRQAT